MNDLTCLKMVCLLIYRLNYSNFVDHIVLSYKATKKIKNLTIKNLVTHLPYLIILNQIYLKGLMYSIESQITDL